MEYPRGFDNHDFDPLLEALEAHVVQRPVPVVVVKVAELHPAGLQLAPERAGERHPHVVL